MCTTRLIPLILITTVEFLNLTYTLFPPPPLLSLLFLSSFQKPSPSLYTSIYTCFFPPQISNKLKEKKMMLSIEFERVFHYIDQDGDGKISPVDLQSCLSKSGWKELSEEAAAAVLASSDSNGDGMLEFDDFVRLVGGEEEEEEEEKLRSMREAFGVYEMEGRGVITDASLKRALEGIGEERSVKECRDMIREFDLDGDGVICFEEFKVMMQC